MVGREHTRADIRGGRFLMMRREITTPTDRLFSRRRFIYYSAAFAAAVACGPAAVPATGSPAASASGPVQLKGTKVNLLHWTSFVPDEDKWFKETLVNDWAKPNGVDLTIELVAANEAQPKIVAALQAGGGPDAMLLQWTWAHLYADKLSDVGTVAEKVGSDGGGFYGAAKQDALVAFKDLFGKASDPQCLSWDDSSNNRAYAAKQIWATLNGASIYLTALTADPDLAKDTQLVLLPAGPKGQFSLGTPFQYAIPKYVKDPGPVRELVSYIMSPKTYGGVMKNGGEGDTVAPCQKGEGEVRASSD